MPTLTKQIIEQYLSDPHNVRLQKWRFSTQFTSGFTAIDVDAAEAMTKHKGSLELQGLTRLGEGAARALSQRKGELNLTGLTSLSEGVARALSQHKGRLHLFGLTSLSDGAAEALAATASTHGKAQCMAANGVAGGREVQNSTGSQIVVEITNRALEAELSAVTAGDGDAWAVAGAEAATGRGVLCD